MARAANVEGVIAGIVDAYRRAKDTEPAAQDLIAASGVSSATYYRVLEQHPEAQAALAAGRAGFAAASGSADEPEPEDPIKKDPHGAVRELRKVIANLALAVEERDQRIRRLEGQLRAAHEHTSVPPIDLARARRNRTNRD
jgi:hypothetical protein